MSLSMTYRAVPWEKNKPSLICMDIAGHECLPSEGQAIITLLFADGPLPATIKHSVLQNPIILVLCADWSTGFPSSVNIQRSKHG